MQHNMHINMQIELNVMDQFIVIFLVLLLAKMIHQTSFFWQIHEQVVTSQIFYGSRDARTAILVF